jgi:hypothetical protein
MSYSFNLRHSFTTVSTESRLLNPHLLQLGDNETHVRPSVLVAIPAFNPEIPKSFVGIVVSFRGDPL